MRVCLGGTFDILHIGHRRLLSKAFEIGDYIYIGLTTDEFARGKGRRIKPYQERKIQLARLIEEYLPPKCWQVAPLSDRYGPATDGNFDAIVVSPATEEVARGINRIRRRRGLNELAIVIVPFSMAEDGLPISSGRIALGEIDACGRVLEPKGTVSKRTHRIHRPDTSAL